ncbi:NAD(P)H-dependent flavin oxidoreductase [Flexivirga alba]|uniref:Propionate 3-nitronate monooxygenase n=1 Tax=Flexivirga alba TaxID=702742 RepID=A0ABW2AL58_9MICO
MNWSLSRLPIVGAPMAGTGTPELAAAISNAGGLGVFPGGYLTGDKLAEGVARVRELTDRPFGVNLFVPTPVDEQRDSARLRSYAEALAPLATSADVQLPEPRWDGSDNFAAKVDVLEQSPVAVVSFIFGPPPVDVVLRLHTVGTKVLATVTDAGRREQPSLRAPTCSACKAPMPGVTAAPTSPRSSPTAPAGVTCCPRC